MVSSPRSESNDYSPAEIIDNIIRHVQEDESGQPMRLVHGDITDNFIIKNEIIKKERLQRANRRYENIEDIPAFHPIGRAACSDTKTPEIFSTGTANTKKTKKEQRNETLAKAICATCFVKQDCLDYALKYNTKGIWGGLNEDQRNLLYKRLLK